ncbi:LysR family transcriptional regulator [Lapidilactobacillus mulanensis]|uniref:LysR family transcriptional regulator n=1 Tax=Lapidilactobacillus mulanensis TaxID=2485999 RepID=A0ABW4DNV3_9LACO|nr:LysR family transcriptional regulator [Lapidilactobacillus mulanensis]
MNFDQLAAFRQVAEEKSFSQAAVFLNITQSALSKQIINLEKELDIQLIDRENRRRIKLTPAGEQIYQYAATILTQQQMLLRIVGEFQNLERGTLKIAAIPVISQYEITPILAEFMTDYPQIELQLYEGENDVVLDRLKNNRADMAIVRDGEGLATFKQQSLITSDDLVAVVPADRKFPDRPIHLDELRDAEFVLLPEDSGVQSSVLQLCQQAGFTPNIRFVSTHIETVVDIVREAQQVSLLYRRTVTPFLNEHIRILELAESYHSDLKIVLPNGVPQPAAQRLKHYLLTHLSS